LLEALLREVPKERDQGRDEQVQRALNLNSKLGQLIRSCLSLVPENRPKPTDIQTRLRSWKHQILFPSLKEINSNSFDLLFDFFSFFPPQLIKVHKRKKKNTFLCLKLQLWNLRFKISTIFVSP
jgi:hypothetical protein